jgi:aminopeptidase N
VNKVIFFVVLSCCSAFYAQQSTTVNFKKIMADIELQPDSSKVIGKANFYFEVLQEMDSVFVDAKGFTVCNNDAVKWINYDLTQRYDGEKLWIKGRFQPGVNYQYSVYYEAVPKKALYFLKDGEDWNIWSQGQGKYTSHWLPSFDDVNQKTQIELKIRFDKGYTVLANGALVESTELEEERLWHYKLDKPMSSYLIALAIGKYNKTDIKSASGIPIELYYHVSDSLKSEPTYRHTKAIFDFFEQELDYPYPWGTYRQVPVHDFLYAGMENTSLTIFSDAFVVDSIAYNDKNYVNVNAHELAHQWFGDLVTARSGEHHWLQEGFATYYALLAEKQLFGDDHYYFELYQSAQQLGRQDDAGEGTSLLDPKSSSLTFYQRGAWVLHALRTRMGNAAFRRAVNSYLKVHEFVNADTEDFFAIVEAETGEDYGDFKNLWLIPSRFPFEAAIALLREQSPFIVEYMMINCEANSAKCAEYLRYGASDEAKIKVISQRPDLVTKNTFKNSWKVRQAIAQYSTKIPLDLKSEFESLLHDPSYLTIESALYNLWVNFPIERSRYLSQTKNIEGFADKNVRLLWLVLHLNTPEYQSDQKAEIYNELLSYTNPEYHAELRMNAFQYLELLKACNEACQSNLEQAKKHHNWRLVNFAKSTLNSQ